MPQYEYKCPECGAVFTNKAPVWLCESIARCPKCLGKWGERVFSVPMLNFKGSGWARPGYQ